jgi:F0F1-type ATP synthase assembly protein I
MSKLYEGLAGFIEREAGHVIVSLVLMVVGFVMWQYKFPKGEDIAMVALGYLGHAMKNGLASKSEPK